MKRCILELMVIVSIKGYEKDPAEWKIKARIVFRGDAAVRDQGGLSAIFQDLAASAPSSIAALNTVVAFSMIEGHTCSTSDCARACIQSTFGTKHRTFVMLPPASLSLHQRSTFTIHVRSSTRVCTGTLNHPPTGKLICQRFSVRS